MANWNWGLTQEIEFNQFIDHDIFSSLYRFILLKQEIALLEIDYSRDEKKNGRITNYSQVQRGPLVCMVLHYTTALALVVLGVRRLLRCAVCQALCPPRQEHLHQQNKKKYIFYFSSLEKFAHLDMSPSMKRRGRNILLLFTRKSLPTQT